ncbi:type I-E CRISPR-associated protein Cas6/Cse3/CasE [Bifidobacterium myosotis]|nr:type I-E CRISPR-associated protein Cas6/Cse3/CasE [Bifidobacterium myosotis]
MLIHATATMNTDRFDVRRTLASRERIHAAVMAAADGSARPLWRLDGDRLHVVCDRLAPDRLSARLGGAVVRVEDYGRRIAAIDAGMTLSFALEADPTRTVARPGRRGLRVPVTDPEARLRWLSDRLADAGCRAGRTLIVSETTDRFVKPDRSVAIRRAVRYRGRLTVLDPDRLRATLAAGVGGGKAYGNGLLTVAPIRG